MRIRFADDSAATDRAAGEGGAEDVGIMVGAGVVVDARGAAELAPGDDQRRFEQAALLGLAPASFGQEL